MVVSISLATGSASTMAAVEATTAIEDVAGERSISSEAAFESEPESEPKSAGLTSGALSPRPLPSSSKRVSFFFAKKTPKFAPGKSTRPILKQLRRCC